MQINFRARTRKPLSMTSLIDIIFLLLLFFMLTSTFSKHDEIEIKTAVSGGGSSQQKPDLFISISEGLWKINGSSVSPESISEYIKELDRGEQISAVLHVTTDLPSQSLIDAFALLEREGVIATVVK